MNFLLFLSFLFFPFLLVKLDRSTSTPTPERVTKKLTETPKRSVSCVLQTIRRKKKSRPSPLDVDHLFGINILIVDDNPINLNILRKHLNLISFSTSTKIKRIKEARNGLEALDLMRIYTFDIILLDIDMPLLNGVETAKQIRTNLNSTVPIIAVTTNDSIESKDNYLKVGMNDCLGKPVDLQLLEQTISKSLIYSSPLTLTPPIKE